VAGVVLTAAAAIAGWTARSGSATAIAAAAVVQAPGMPAATVRARTVTLSWPAVQASGYRVLRYAPTGPGVPARNGCAGVVHTHHCTESGVPSGTWRYAVLAVLGPTWTGPPSPLSAPVGIGGHDASPPDGEPAPAAGEPATPTAIPEPTPEPTPTATAPPAPQPTSTATPEPTALSPDPG